MTDKKTTDKKTTDDKMDPVTSVNILRFIADTPGSLFWRKKDGEKEIEFLNDTESMGPGDDAGKLLRDLVWARDVVVEDDFPRFKLFIKALREGKEASIIFRLRETGKTPDRRWVRITGAPSEGKPLYYYGWIFDMTRDVDFINRLLEKDLERQTMIESEDIPVLLVDMETKSVISRSTFAYDLFGYTYHEFNDLKFRDLYPPDGKSGMPRAYETCLLEGRWEGDLTLLKKGNVSFNAGVKLKRLSVRDRNLLKISIHSIRGETVGEGGVPGTSPDLLAAMEGKDEIGEILDTLLAHEYVGSPFDAVLYADVYVKKGRVDVYSRGEPFLKFKSGTSYDYEGTVSQIIREDRLEFFILGDTFESTRTIDWALFIPHGIRSYFARPFFHGTNLRTLLIFCSTEPNRFTEADIELFESYYPAFLQGLRNWRKKKRG